MKKSLLLLVAGALTISAGAQYAKPASLLLNSPTTLNPNAPLVKKITPPARAVGVAGRHSSERTTSITSCTYTETFPSTVLTSGGSGGTGDIWTTVGSPGGWTQTLVASTSGNALPALASTTASDGWMIFDCDLLRGTSTTITPTGYLQSPAINCSALSTVGLSFQQLFQGGAQDTCYVAVSTSSTFASGVTYYPIAPCNTFLAYDRCSNPDTILLDITTAAAHESSVYIRFIYQDQMYWGFSWQIDDVCVGALSSHDVGLYHDFMWQPNNSTSAGAGPSSIFEMPLIFIDNTDSIYPTTTLTNYASTIETTVPVTANIYGPGTAYSQTINYANLPIAALDSSIIFPGYYPGVMGAYTCAYNAALTTDADPANNVDTSTFDVDDTAWNDNYGQLLSDYAFYVYGTGTTPYESFVGSRFDVSPNIAVPAAGVYPSDTVTSFSVAFAGGSGETVATGSGKVTVQLYSRGPSSGVYTFMGESVPRALVTTDISTSSGIVYATFQTFNGYGPYVDPIVGGGNFVLQANTSYAAVVQTSGVTSNILVLATQVPAPTYYDVSYLGQGFTSNNDGAADFGTSNATGETWVPLVSMNFGTVPHQNYHVGVQNVTYDNFIGQPFPNPSTTSFTIPITMAQDSKVTVSLMTITGEAVNTQVVNTIGGQSAPVVFNTSALAAGMYIYTVQANGVNTTGRVVVSH